MIKFDLENVEDLQQIELSEIDSVHLSLNVFFSKIIKASLCSLHTVDYEWNEMEVNWNQARDDQPWKMIPQTGNDDTFALESAGDMDIDPVSTTMSDTVGFWQHWNITEIIKTFIENPSENHGFMIRTSAELQPHYYYSSNHDSIEVRPKLTFYMNGVSIKSYNNNRIGKMITKVSLNKNNLSIKFKDDYTRSVRLFNVNGRAITKDIHVDSNIFNYSFKNNSENVFILRINEGLQKSYMKIINSN